MNASAIVREIRALYVEQQVEPRAKPHVRAAFLGDADAAFSLYASLSDGERAQVAVLMFRARVKHEAFGVFLQATWEHDHRNLIAAAGTRQRLRAMFRRAQFPIPEALPARVPVWRGTSALTFAKAARGFSWTTDRDIACWFAMRFAEHNPIPLVLAAEVDRAEIALFTDERGEREATILRPPKSVRIDGDFDDWARGHKRVQQQRTPQAA